MGNVVEKNRKVEHEKVQESLQAEFQEWQERTGLLTETYATANTLLRAVKQEAEDVSQWLRSS